MILCTGSRGFVAGHLIRALRDAGHATMGIDKEHDIGKVLASEEYSAIFHLGAISNTTCDDYSALSAANIALPKRLAEFCHGKRIPFIYASSASVYGNGDGPLNPYAHSKAAFDNEMLSQPPACPWYGLRFFNVYGDGEAHKGKQASVVSQMLGGSRTLFDIDATRDFVHVDDVVSVLLWIWKNLPPSGIYDVGTGVAEPFEAIPMAIAKVTGQNMEIKRVPFPESLKGKYQMHTCADLTKLRAAGYDKPFMSLEDGVARMVAQ